MTKRDIELITRVLRETGGVNEHSHKCLVRAFTEELAKANPHFDPLKFKIASTSREAIANIEF